MAFALKNNIIFFICTKIALIIYLAIGILRKKFHHIFNIMIGENFEKRQYGCLIKGDDYAYRCT